MDSKKNGEQKKIINISLKYTKEIINRYKNKKMNSI